MTDERHWLIIWLTIVVLQMNSNVKNAPLSEWNVAFLKPLFISWKWKRGDESRKMPWTVNWNERVKTKRWRQLVFCIATLTSGPAPLYKCWHLAGKAGVDGVYGTYRQLHPPQKCALGQWPQPYSWYSISIRNWQKADLTWAVTELLSEFHA